MDAPRRMANFHYLHFVIPCLAGVYRIKANVISPAFPSASSTG